MKTRSGYYKTPWLFEVREVELPEAVPAGQALIKIEACGVCGSDLIWAAEHVKEWAAFGHEIAGEIAKLGPGAPAHLKIGQKVVLESAGPCGVCDLCRNGRVDLCNKQPQFWNQPAMGNSDYMFAPVGCIVPYEGLTPEVASLTEPAGVGFDLVKTAEIQIGERVCVVGPGPIALCAVALAAKRGVSRLLCIGLPQDKKRLEIARDLGAETLMTDKPLDQIAELKHQFDHVLMTAPTKFIPAAMSLLAVGGIMTFIGLAHGDPKICFDADDFHFRKLQLRSSFASPALYFPATLALMKNGTIPGERIISHVFKLNELQKAMETCRDDKLNTSKVVIVP